MSPKLGYCASNGELIKADKATGRTCLGICGQWKTKENFRVVPSTGNLFAYCHNCMNARNKGKWHVEKVKPEYRLTRYKRNKASKAKLKQEVITGYGGACTCCGESSLEFLTLDHVDGEGSKHRRDNNLTTGATSTWTWARKMGYPDVLRLLCWNCNSARGAYGYCPHEMNKKG